MVPDGTATIVPIVMGRMRKSWSFRSAFLTILLCVGISRLAIPVRNDVNAEAVKTKQQKLIAHQGRPTLYVCSNNSLDARCCSNDHCRLVRRSTMFSSCCQNLPFFNGTMADQAIAEIKTGHQIYELTRTIPILVTATPRSGTVFLQTLLQKLGVSTVNDMRSPTPTTKAMVSWIHIRKDQHYFGNARIYGSTFEHVWHFVRDPMKSLTSIAFTEPLKDTPYNSEGTRSYLTYLRRHIHLTDRDVIEQELQHASSTSSNQNETEWQRDSKFLMYRGMEFYIQWHTFLLDLHLPRISLEDLTVQQDLEGLNDIFLALGLPIPSPDRVAALISGLRRSRRLAEHTNSRNHRPLLTWEELCRVSVALTQTFLSLCHDLGYYEDLEEVCPQASR